MKAIIKAVAISVALPVSFCAVADDKSSNQLGGPVVAGVCLLSREAVVAQSKVGKDISEKLQKLAADAQAEVNRDKAQLEPELQKLGLNKPGLQESQLNEQQRAGLQKAQALQQKVRDRSAQVDATREKALERVATEVQPVIAKVYAKHGCGLLFNRSGVLGGNMGNDLTPEVIEGLNAKITAMPVTLEPAPKPKQ